YGTSWDKSLPCADFSYNNTYQDSLKKSPFEELYGKRCRTLFFWNQTGEKQIVRENLRVAYSWKRSYADVRRRDLAFKVDNHVYLKVSPMRGPPVQYERKASTQIDRALPPNSSGVHDVFHVSPLKKCLKVLRRTSTVLEGLEKELPETKRPGCDECSAVTIQRLRLYGNERMS
ncbi:hypothetical protein U9M48_027636, partial [Paspalum notatum var. saurae]